MSIIIAILAAILVLAIYANPAQPPAESQVPVDHILGRQRKQ